MTLALLESIIFNRLTGQQSSPITAATTLASLRITKLQLVHAILMERLAMAHACEDYTLRIDWNKAPWFTMQDVLNSFQSSKPDNP